MHESIPGQEYDVMFSNYILNVFHNVNKCQSRREIWFRELFVCKIILLTQPEAYSPVRMLSRRYVLWKSTNALVLLLLTILILQL